MITVYFDSNFYVWLARARDEAAATCIDALNGLDVRGVLSNALFQELASSVGREAPDARLHSRLMRLARLPYTTHPGLGWEFLLVGGDSRRSVADALERIANPTLMAESLTVLANNPRPHRRHAAATAQAVGQLPELRRADGSLDQDALRAFTTSLFEPLHLPMVVPDLSTPELRTEFAAQLNAMVSDAQHHALDTRRRLIASAVATDNRPYETVLGTASPKTMKGLAHTFRDAGDHMACFVEHAAAIDNFQMDGPQHRLLARGTHELRRIGLHERCFTAVGLDDAIEQVRKFAAKPG